jgi:hypothetical protein
MNIGRAVLPGGAEEASEFCSAGVPTRVFPATTSPIAGGDTHATRQGAAFPQS